MKLKTQQSKRFTIYALCFIFLIFGFYASAAVEYQLIQPLPGIKTVSSFPDYIQKLIPFVLSLAAVLAVVMIVVGGIEYAVSEAVSSKAEAKDRIMQAIWGLLLALISYLILYTINPDLTSLKLDPNPAGTVAPTTQPSIVEYDRNNLPPNGTITIPPQKRKQNDICADTPQCESGLTCKEATTRSAFKRCLP